MAPRLTPEARDLLTRQRGLIADWQAASVGLSRRRLLWACRSGWRTIGQHVFVDRDGDYTPEQMRVAGALEGGPDAALTGRAALLESGWRGRDEGYVDVLLPRSARGRTHRGPPWLRLHFPLEVPRSAGSPPRTTSARAAIDAASWSRSPREVLLVVLSTAQQRLATPDGLRREMLRRPGLRNAAAIRDVLEELEAGATSSNESAFLRECRCRGLPKPRMQTRRRDAGGRRRFTDAEFVLPDGRLVIVEIDGIGHLDVAEWHADIARHNGLAVTTGAITLRVTGWEIHHDPNPFFTLLAGLLSGGVSSIPTI